MIDYDALAAGWLGYGHWSAPYWFVGMEHGGDEGEAKFRAWESLGRQEMLDIAEAHRFQTADWFSASAATQRTWAKLIWLLLAFKGIEPTRDATLDYQRSSFGRISGEVALPELSPFAAPTIAVEAPRQLLRDERIVSLRERMREFKPQFVVFYSSNRLYIKAWEAICETQLIKGVPKRIGNTICVVTDHPGFQRSKAYWKRIASDLRSAIELK